MNTRQTMIADRLASIDLEREAIEEQLAGLPDAIRAARVDALRRAPTAASDGIGTDVRRLSEKQSKAERRLEALAAERQAAVQVAEEEAEKARAQLTRELVARGSALRAQEIHLWQQAGTALAELVELFEVRICGVARDLEGLRHQAKRGGLDPDGVPELQDPVRPRQAHATAFIELILQAATDPGGLGRRDVGQPHATRSDDEWRLGGGLIPDLRGAGRVRLLDVEQAVAVFGS